MVPMGRVTAPFGVKGWIKIYALTAPATNLCDYPVWWLGREGDWRETLIPFIAGAIQTVDLANGVIRVEWGRDY